MLNDLFIFLNVTEDAGTYTCTATNQFGSGSTSATLQVPGERPTSYIK